MKKIIFLILLIASACISCKKDPDPPITYLDPVISAPDSIAWDSLSYTIINYSYLSELKSDQLNDSSAYTHSVRIEPRLEPLNLEANQIFVLKRFDMVGKSGKIMYYIPYSGEPSAAGASLKLPWLRNTGEGRSSISIPVIRYRE